MKQPSLRVLLPLLLLVVLLAVGGASLSYSVQERQRHLTEDARSSVLGLVGRLSQLAERGWGSAPQLVTADLMQIANRPRVRAVILFADSGQVLAAHQPNWVGRTMTEVWPELDMERVLRAARLRLPDWQLSADRNRMDAMQAIELPPLGAMAGSPRRGLVYVAFDLAPAREQAMRAEIMSRVPDMVGLAALLGLMVWLLSRYVARPLARLDQVATALRSGQWDVVIPRGGFQELDRLAEGFEALRQELAATWRAMPDLLFEMGADGRYLRVVAARPELLISAPEALVGRTVHDVMPPSAAQAVLQALHDANDMGGVWGREVLLDVAAGQRWFEISVARKTAPALLGASATFMVISRDITARKQTEERLRQLNEELECRVSERTAELLTAKNEAERANQSKSDFLSRMSHELRTPLNAILGFGQLLELSVREPLLNGHVRQILQGGKHLLSLINEVLDLARVESGQMSVSLEKVLVHELVHECLALVQPQAQVCGVRLLDVRCHERFQVLADRIRLKQVLLNLLSNAIKYNSEGGEVSLGCVLDESFIVLYVRDTGPGLTAEQQARLFVPFERLGADTQRVEGTGIGLALSKRLVALMGGQIGVDSVPGVGSTFWVKLSRVVDEAPAPPPLPPVREQRMQTDESQVARTVLCIEDNPHNLQLIDSVLGMLPGVRMLGAISPSLGLELARTHQPDLILLDINLPDMDGFAVMQCLREHPATQRIPVIGVSAHAMPQDLERGRAAGFADYITKPIDVGRLLRLVDELAGVT